MCDYSLMHVKSRPASVGDKLRTSNFGTGTRGFAAPNDPSTAVCVLPGTELAFNSEIAVYGASGPTQYKTAIFRQINREQPHMHHDARHPFHGFQYVDGRAHDGRPQAGGCSCARQEKIGPGSLAGWVGLQGGWGAPPPGANPTPGGPTGSSNESTHRGLPGGRRRVKSD